MIYDNTAGDNKLAVAEHLSVLTGSFPLMLR